MQKTHKIPTRKNFLEAFYGGLSKSITPYIAKTKLTPNQVTIIAGFIGIVGAILLVYNNALTAILAGLAIQLSAIFDAVDGDLARKKNLCSIKGAWIDTFFDKLLDFLLILGLTAGVYNRVQSNHVIWLGLLLMGAQFFIQFISIYNNQLKIRLKNNEITRNNDPSYIGNHEVLLIKRMNRFINTQLEFKGMTFWFLLSLFAFVNHLYIGLIFLSAYALVSLCYSIVLTFYRIK